MPYCHLPQGLSDIKDFVDRVEERDNRSAQTRVTRVVRALTTVARPTAWLDRDKFCKWILGNQVRGDGTLRTPHTHPPPPPPRDCCAPASRLADAGR
jgi:hypothetical protein